MVSTNLGNDLWETIPTATVTYSQQNVLDFTQIYSRIGEEEAKERIKAIVGEKKLNRIFNALSNIVNVKELAALLKWLTDVLKLEVEDVDIIYEVEENVPQFVGIFVKGCDWEEWGKISKTVKAELVREGFKELASHVVIVCPEALGTPKA